MQADLVVPRGKLDFYDARSIDLARAQSLHHVSDDSIGHQQIPP